jgi:hypothetical protein
MSVSCDVDEVAVDPSPIGASCNGPHVLQSHFLSGLDTQGVGDASILTRMRDRRSAHLPCTGVGYV